MSYTAVMTNDKERLFHIFHVIIPDKYGNTITGTIWYAADHDAVGEKIWVIIKSLFQA